MKRLPFDVIIWHRVQSTPPDLHERIIERAGREPDEGFEMQGFCDMHWGCQTAQVATDLAESLFEFAALDDVVVLVVLALEDESFGRKIYKDVSGRSKPASDGHFKTGH